MAASKTSDTKTHKRDWTLTGALPDATLSEADKDQADDLKHEGRCTSSLLTTFTWPENRRVHVVRCVACGAMSEVERSR